MQEKNKEKFLLKDALFNQAKVEKIAEEIQKVYAPFEKKPFSLEVLEQFPQLELKERMYHIRDLLQSYLPADYVEAATILLQALPPELDPTKRDDDFGDFIYAAYAEFVCSYGFEKEHLDFSLNALREMTKRFSVEFAIRDFINMYPKETLAMLEACAKSENYHERRLASEGLRPKLPWAKKLTLDYKEAMKPLHLLYHDKTRYVTRSVANHLNDISKIDAPLVVETLKRWQASGKQNEKEMQFIIKHALRTLVKQGYEEALTFLGYKQKPSIVSKLTLQQKELVIGEVLIFDIEIEAKEDLRLMIDYCVDFCNKRGTLSTKVYKVKQIVLAKGERYVLQKKQHMKKNMTTRKLHAGTHSIALQINGKRSISSYFELLT